MSNRSMVLVATLATLLQLIAVSASQAKVDPKILQNLEDSIEKLGPESDPKVYAYNTKVDQAKVKMHELKDLIESLSKDFDAVQEDLLQKSKDPEPGEEAVEYGPFLKENAKKRPPTLIWSKKPSKQDWLNYFDLKNHQNLHEFTDELEPVKVPEDSTKQPEPIADMTIPDTVNAESTSPAIAAESSVPKVSDELVEPTEPAEPMEPMEPKVPRATIKLTAPELVGPDVGLPMNYIRRPARPSMPRAPVLPRTFSLNGFEPSLVPSKQSLLRGGRSSFVMVNKQMPSDSLKSVRTELHKKVQIPSNRFAAKMDEGTKKGSSWSIPGIPKYTGWSKKQEEDETSDSDDDDGDGVKDAPGIMGKLKGSVIDKGGNALKMVSTGAKEAQELTHLKVNEHSHKSETNYYHKEESHEKAARGHLPNSNLVPKIDDLDEFEEPDEPDELDEPSEPTRGTKYASKAVEEFVHDFKNPDDDFDGFEDESSSYSHSEASHRHHSQPRKQHERHGYSGQQHHYNHNHRHRKGLKVKGLSNRAKSPTGARRAWKAVEDKARKLMELRGYTLIHDPELKKASRSLKNQQVRQWDHHLAPYRQVRARRY